MRYGESILMKKALVAIDLSEISRKTAVFAFDHAKDLGVDQLDFIHVLEFRDQMVPRMKEYAREYDENKIKEDILELIKEALEESSAPSLAHNLIIKTGSPYQEIVRKAEEDRYELIFIGHRGMSDIEEFLLGSVAAKVVRHAPCDVLVHRPKKDKS